MVVTILGLDRRLDFLKFFDQPHQIQISNSFYLQKVAVSVVVAEAVAVEVSAVVAEAVIVTTETTITKS